MGKSPVIEERRPESVEELQVPTCQHHWIIETPRGTMSKGRCKRCGEEREFRNSATDHLWEDESGSGYNAWRGVRSVRRAVSDDEDAAAASSEGGPALIV